MKNKIISIVIKGLLIIAGMVGLIATGIGSDFMGGGKLLLYFTIQSNLWIIGITIPFLVFAIKGIKNDVEIPNVLYLIKFIFTIAISLTFVVFAILLAPMMGIEYLLSPGNLCLHYIVPILAIVDCILYDYKMKIKFHYCFLPMIMPVYYFIFAMICAGLNVEFSTGSKFPYYFLDYEANGWFDIEIGSIGVAYWVGIMLVYIYGATVLFLSILKKRAKKMSV